MPADRSSNNCIVVVYLDECDGFDFTNDPKKDIDYRSVLLLVGT